MHKVLLVDDEELIRNAISRMIDWKALGCEVIATARNGSEAYQIYLDSYPEIIITDLMMPVMDGIEFMERIREKDQEVKVIVLSGYGEFEYAQKALRLGARDYILKPMSVEDMSALIQLCVREIEADKARKLFRGEGEDFFRMILLEMLNSPNDIDDILRRYPIGGVESGGASVISCDFGENQERRVAAAIKAFGRKNSFGIPFPPISAGSSIYAIFIAEDLDSYLKIKDELKDWEYASHIYHGGISQAFRYLLDQISIHKELAIITSDGTRHGFSNEAGYIKRISMLSDSFRELFGSSSRDKIMPDIYKAMAELHIDDAKAVLMRLLMSMDEIDIQEGMNVLQGASSSGEIFKYLQSMVSHRIPSSSQDDGLSYPVRRIKEYISQHYTDEWLSLKSIAKDVMYMDAAYLSKLFHKETGIKFSDYVNQIRVDKAKELMGLYHKSMIFEIAEEVGFGNNPRYFSQVFRKYTGISPSDYIKAAERGKTGNQGG